MASFVCQLSIVRGLHVPYLPPYPSQVDRHVLALPPAPLLHYPDRRFGGSRPRAIPTVQQPKRERLSDDTLVCRVSLGSGDPQIQWMTNSIRHTRHGTIYRSIPDPTPNGQGVADFGTRSLALDFDVFKDPVFMSKALVSAVLLTYFAIALGYAIRHHRRKLHPHGPDATRFPACCDPPCTDCGKV